VLLSLSSVVHMHLVPLVHPLCASSLGVLFGEGMDPMAGGAGWAGWVGAGLLGPVLGWLLFIYLPAKDKQLKEMIADKDALVTKLIQGYETRLDTVSNVYRGDTKEMRDSFERALQSVLGHCEKEFTRIAEAVRTEIKLAGAPSSNRETGNPGR
jgi:hypothetical protein